MSIADVAHALQVGGLDPLDQNAPPEREGIRVEQTAHGLVRVLIDVGDPSRRETLLTEAELALTAAGYEPMRSPLPFTIGGMATLTITSRPEAKA